MSSNPLLIYLYIAFVWLIFAHTLEEIADGVFGLRVGPLHLEKKRYLAAASLLSALNLATLALLMAGLPAGYYLGLFTSAVPGMFQGIIHTIGFVRAGRRPTGMGVGFYSSIPLALVGAAVFYLILLAQK